ncbi:MAG TPA: glycerol-3-phosphate 1-O-acyltransferase PlsY [Terriglobia bacterium]|nr:glycerol-3-phosphate 1-O-acyltransferase PlsY [Terriglobia bacterium]
MHFNWTGIVVLILAYGLGSIPFGYLIVRLGWGTDIRTLGSGNIGAANVLRSSSRWGGILTLLMDAAKGFLAVCAARHFVHGNEQYVAMAAVAVVAGHVFPVFLKFKGGKGVATAAGVFLCLAPLPLLTSLAIFVMVVAIWRFVSLGSIISAGSFCILYFLFEFSKDHSLWILSASVVCSCLIVVRHRENIKRLVMGTENRFSRKRK